MKNILILSILVFAGLNIYSQTPTIIGVHGVSNPQVLQNLGVQITRYGFTDYQIKNAIQNNYTQAFNKAQVLDSLNIKQVVYLTWPDTTTVAEHDQRIPSASDSMVVFQYLDTFLNEIGPYIDYIQISQEPLGLTKYTNYAMQDVLDWWQCVVSFIRNQQILYPNNLAHIKIITGGINSIHNAVNDPSSQFAHLVDSVITFGENYCDAIDLHMHVTDVTMEINIVDYIINRTNQSLTCTEWSQARIAFPEGTDWLSEINSAFGPLHRYYGLTNYEVIDSCYNDTTTISEWNSFISTSPRTPGFMYDFYAVADSNCFEFVCYGGAFQYGSPKHDWKQLYTNQTVVQNNPQNIYHNDLFYDEFTALADTITGGYYNTNCLLVGIDKPIKYCQKLFVYPNPFSNFATISFYNPDNKKYTLKLFNILGENVLTIENISTDEIIIGRENLIKGFYIIRLNSAKQINLSGKLIVD